MKGARLRPVGWLSMVLGLVSILAGGFALLVWQAQSPDLKPQHLLYPAYGLMLGGIAFEVARASRQPVLRVAVGGLVLNLEALALIGLSVLGNRVAGVSIVSGLEKVVFLGLAFLGYEAVVAAARRDAATRRDLLADSH